MQSVEDVELSPLYYVIRNTSRPRTVEEAAMSRRVQLIMRRRNRVSEVAVETSETFCSLLKVVGWGV